MRTLVRRLEAVVLGRSPLPGKTRALDRAVILTRIKQSGIDPALLDLQIPSEVMVTRAAVTVGREQIEQIIREYIQQQAAGAADELRIKDIRISEPVVLPQGPLTTRVVAPKNTEWAGTIPLSVVFNVGGGRGTAGVGDGQPRAVEPGWSWPGGRWGGTNPSTTTTSK